jgi:hypothetical protein
MKRTIGQQIADDDLGDRRWFDPSAREIDAVELARQIDDAVNRRSYALIREHLSLRIVNGAIVARMYGEEVGHETVGCAVFAAAEAVCEAHLWQRALWEKVNAGDKSDETTDAIFAAATETGEKIDILRACLAEARVDEGTSGAPTLKDFASRALAIVQDYLPPDSGISEQQAFGALLELIDTHPALIALSRSGGAS